MKWERSEVIPKDYRLGPTRRLVIEWDDYDLVQLDLDAFDRALLRECNFTHSLADGLLALELIARRTEQQRATT